MRDSFIIYRSFYEAIVDLPTDAQAQVWKAICEYSLNFTEPELTGIARTVFTLIRPQLEANIKRYANGKKQDGSKLKANEKQNGSKMEAKEKQKRSKTEANKNHNHNHNENENEKRSGRAAYPTLDEVITFFTDNGYTRDIAVKAYHYYAEAGWKDSRGEPVRAWKQKMRGVWFKDENKQPQAQVLSSHYNPAVGDVPAVWQPIDQYRPV